MRKKNKVYLDQAATSFPKPEAVYRAADGFARRIGIGNDRGFYRESREVARIGDRTREGIAELINCPAGDLIFTSGATESLNTAILGLLQPGDHVITSPFEHNSVIRPLSYLALHRGVTITRLDASLQDGVFLDRIEQEILPATRMCLINHISNAFGVVMKIGEIGELLRRHPEIAFVVDGAQSMGTYPIDVEEMGIDFLAFSGHKGLLGPTGTGGFYIRDTLAGRVLPLKFGGTGIRSTREIFIEELPHRFEVGTQNSWGIAGLQAGVDYIREKTVPAIHRHIQKLTGLAVEELSRLESVVLYVPSPDVHHGVVSFNLTGLPPRETASLLDRVYNIKVRDGLHCAPEAHRTAGTFPEGTVRASFGVFNTEEEVKYLCTAISEIAQSFKGK